MAKNTRKGVIYYEKNFIFMFSKQGDAEPSPVSHSLATEVWNAMSASAQWAANQAFLDKAIQAGQKFTLSTNAYKAVPGTYFHKEIQYLLNHGYKIVEYGWAMIKK